MFRWLDELFDIRIHYLRKKLELQEEQAQIIKVCSSCEILKAQLDTANHERSQLLSKFLNKETEPDRPVQPMQSMPRINHLPFRVRQQMLEAEDRAKAIALRKAAQPDSVEDLEKELNVVAAERGESQ